MVCLKGLLWWPCGHHVILLVYGEQCCKKQAIFQREASLAMPVDPT